MNCALFVNACPKRCFLALWLILSRTIMYIFSAFILCPFDYAKRCTHVICLCSAYQSYLIRYMLLFFCVFYVNIVSVDRPIPVTGGVSYIVLNAHSQIRFWMGNKRAEIPTLPFDIYMCDFVCGTMLS